MDPGALAAGGIAGIIGLLIGIAIAGLIGALFIMLGSRLVMGSTATFGSAFVAAIVAAFAAFIIQLVVGMALGMMGSSGMMLAPIIALVAGIVVTVLIYSAMVKVGDGRKPTYMQSFLIYLIQLVIALAIGALLVFGLGMQIPGMTGAS
jgi:hypothetical protein